MLEGKVIRIVARAPHLLTPDPSTRVVINLGSEHGVRLGQQFLIYVLGDEICDPETGENLGQLEIVRGRGRVQHVQPKMATLTSSEERSEVQKLPMLPFETRHTVVVPFDEGLAVGDLVRAIGPA